MNELKKLFHRSKSKTRKPSTSSPRADRSDNDTSQLSPSPSRPSPQRQRSNTLPTVVPPVNTHYNELPDGRAPDTEASSLHARKASLPDPARSTARKPVGTAAPTGLDERQSRARSETRQSSAPGLSSQYGYGSNVSNAGAPVAPTEAYGTSNSGYNNVSESPQYGQDTRQQPPLPSNARNTISNAQMQQQFSSSSSSSPMAAVGAVSAASGAQHSRAFSGASKSSELPIASEFSSDSWYRKEAPNASPYAEPQAGTTSARSSLSRDREMPTRGRAPAPVIPPVPSIPIGMSGSSSMDTQPQPLNISKGATGHRRVDSDSMGRGAIRNVEQTSPRYPDKSRNGISTFATPSTNGTVIEGPYKYRSGTMETDFMEDYNDTSNFSRKSHDESRRIAGPGALPTSGNEIDRATIEKNSGASRSTPSKNYASQSDSTPSRTSPSNRYASGTSQSNGTTTMQTKSSRTFSNDTSKGTPLPNEPVAIKSGQHFHRGQLLVQDSDTPVSLRGIVNLSNTEDTTTDVRYAPPVYHDNVTETVHHIREERITREIHNYHVFHRVLPVIDVEVLPAKHLLLLNDLGEVMEIPEPQNWSGQANLENRLKQHSRNWLIAETASKFTDSSILPGPRHHTAMNFNGINDRRFTNSNGIPSTEQWWVYPPMIDDGARRRGITQPIYFDETGTQRSPVGVNEYGGHTLPTN